VCDTLRQDDKDVPGALDCQSDYKSIKSIFPISEVEPDQGRKRRFGLLRRDAEQIKHAVARQCK
jgi:hypothetical protein